MDAKIKREARIKRHHRVRKHVAGTPERPRLAVFRSNKHVYAQLIDDVEGRTLVAASTLDKELELERPATVDAAVEVGRLVGERAKRAGIQQVVFDRGGFHYHGRVAAVADAARDAGLEL